MAEPSRRFPSPWHADPMPGGYIVRDANGQALAYLYSRDNKAEALQAKVLTKHDAQRNHVAEILAQPPAPQTVACPATISLVDDDTLIAASTAALLEDLGHRVVEAHSGKEALAILESGLNPDAVITDYAMPGMTGIDLALKLRGRDPKLPILLATGYAEIQSELPIELPRLAKPFTQEQLSLEIARLQNARHRTRR
jgi:CheY-like chemotaxis protein